MMVSPPFFLSVPPDALADVLTEGSHPSAVVSIVTKV